MTEKKAIDTWASRLRRVPVVLVLGAALLGLWIVSLPGPSSVVCDRAAPAQVYCQANRPRPLAWLPRPQGFVLQEVAIASELCDNTPRGGVRFCHRLTLLGPGRQLTLPEVRTPLSATALIDQLHRYMDGEGSARLSWSGDRPRLPGRTLAIALLLLVATWALWDVRWPPVPPVPLALDGATDDAIDTKH
ncbi:hypothetical protein [Nodosilinea nodulosa]|uniref:hypothetical protein n=1 Tax=Nodosilinea nodulosa TaxID=416001 RepID=UPI0002D2855A|nr:hypothetical protein [Nodosilinea nodulosa]